MYGRITSVFKQFFNSFIPETTLSVMGKGYRRPSNFVFSTYLNLNSFLKVDVLIYVSPVTEIIIRRPIEIPHR